MRWARNWPATGIVGVTTAGRPIVAAVDPNLRKRKGIPAPVPILFGKSCGEWADGWDLTLVVSGIFGCDCTTTSETPARSQDSTVSADGAYTLTYIGPHWEGTFPSSIDYNFYSGVACDTLIENRVSTEIYVRLDCSGFPGGFIATISGRSIDNGIIYQNEFPIFPNSGVAQPNSILCSGAGNAGHLGNATISAVHP